MEIKYVNTNEIFTNKERREANIERCHEKYVKFCYICGNEINREIKNEIPENAENWVQLYHGGDRLTTTDTKLDEDDPGYMGCWPCGNICYKKFLKMLHT